MKPIRYALLGLLSASLFATTAALAQEDIPPGDCQADIDKYCKEVRSGRGRVATCLGEHDGALEPKCQAQMTKYRERQAEARRRMEQYVEACDEDVQKYCANVRPGQGRIVTCLEANQGNLSAACKTAMAEGKERMTGRREAMKGMADACSADAEQFCADVKAGGGRLSRCLKRNESKLSEDCRAAMKGGQQ